MANEKRLIDANALRDDTYIFDAWDAKIVRAWLDDQPTVDAVEVVHAKAVPIYANIRYEDTLIRMDSQCPLCGALMLRVDAYCPSCGAKMDGDGNG